MSNKISSTIPQVAAQPSVQSSDVQSTSLSDNFGTSVKSEPVSCGSLLKTILLSIITLGVYGIVKIIKPYFVGSNQQNRTQQMQDRAVSKNIEQAVNSSGASSIEPHIRWNNRTLLHLSGVCEAATALWLAKIAKEGLDQANTLQPRQCDDLQTKVEDSTWNITLNFSDLLDQEHIQYQMPSERMLIGLLPSDSSSADTSEQIDVNTIKGGSQNRSAAELLGVLKEKDFFCVVATQRTGSGHASGVYFDGNRYHYFDPNHGIYTGTKEQIAAAIEYNTRSWSNVSVHQGSFNPDR